MMQSAVFSPEARVAPFGLNNGIATSYGKHATS